MGGLHMICGAGKEAARCELEKVIGLVLTLWKGGS